ncbi:hypothetical protein [Neoroseomonas rubea]|uniref:hypothetical protein n=1 Tax=Neoroseomonas rubea TaxID=2748666 RepID=UPI0018E05FD9|nr:hypothetical protein [Roseomonas rubea]
MTMTRRYAVVFKAFYFDDFVRRRLAQVVAAAPSADVFLMMDETRRSAGPIDFDRVIRFRESDVVALGFAAIAKGSLLWYNADYPLYYFQHLYPSYDYIAMVEYDAVPNAGLDELIQQCRAQDVDFVGEPILKPLDRYWWTRTLLRFYPPAAIRPSLICAAVFSARAVRHLAERRLEQGRAYDLPDAKEWPIGEAFVGTELALHGFNMRDLASFGQLTHYDWWPPTHESELQRLSGEVFVHPVLTGRRYVMSVFKSGFLSGLIVTAKISLGWLSRRLGQGTPAFARLSSAKPQDQAGWRAVASGALPDSATRDDEKRLP